MEKEVGKLIDKADVLMDKGKVQEAKKLYQRAYDLVKNTDDTFTTDALKEILKNL